MAEVRPANTSSGVNTGSTSSRIDAGSPFYINPLDSPGLVHIPVPFGGTVFHSSRRSVLQSLLVQNKLVIINGKCKRPDATHSTYR